MKFGRALLRLPAVGIPDHDELVAANGDAGVDPMVTTPWSSSRAAREGVEQFAADAALA